GTGGQELQRDLAIEPRIPGAGYLAERTAADPLDEPKMTPQHRSLRSHWLQLRRRDLTERRCARWGGAMEGGDGREYPQLSKEGPRGAFRARFGSCPVDWGSVEDRVDEMVDQLFTRRHVPSPAPAARAPYGLPCAQPQMSACPAPRPAPRS